MVSKMALVVLPILAFLACIFAPLAFATGGRYVAVRGKVFCKSCKYVGVPSLRDAKPVAGAIVVLRCKNTVTNQVTKGTTDSNGNYYIKARKNIKSIGVEKCRVYLASTPSKTCFRTTRYKEDEEMGELLKFSKAVHINSLPYNLYTVIPLTFEYSKKCY